jgi:4'-phosphopantetheinyl transferase
VAVSENPIGVDIEVIRAFKPELMRKTMNQTEQTQILQAEQPNWQFIRLWTQKEAYLKMLGTGIISDLHHVLDNTEVTKWYEISNQSPDYICTIAEQ